MPQYPGDTLSMMVSRVLAAKPNAQQSEIVRSINARIRSVINARIYWSDLLARRIVSIPDPYVTGTVSYTRGSSLIAGTNTSWPVNDVVNTTASNAVLDTGFQEITPASMANIAVDTMLFCDSGNGNQETVAVVQTTPISFWAKFTKTHSANMTLTSSSLAGLQIYPGTNYPVFTVRAVRNATQIELDNPWGGPNLSDQGYQIYKGYTTIDPNLKVVIDIVDQQQGIRLETYIPVEYANSRDPQRTDQGDPIGLVQYTPSEAGSMQFEIWPRATSARQLYVLCGLQWPDLIQENDRPPSFIDPSIFVDGAIADALRIKNVRFGPSSNGVDPWFNPELAMQYEQKFQYGLEVAKNADEAKAQRAYSQNRNWLVAGAGARFWMSHDSDLMFGRF